MRKLIPDVTINLNGITYTLRLDITAMADFEQATGKHVLQFIKPIFDAAHKIFKAGNLDDFEALGGDVVTRLIDDDIITAHDLQALLWACAGGEDSGLTMREAGRLIHTGNIAEVGQTLFRTAANAMPRNDNPNVEVQEAEANDGAAEADPNTSSPIS
jgi:hypothetical protein